MFKRLASLALIALALSSCGTNPVPPTPVPPTPVPPTPVPPVTPPSPAPTLTLNPTTKSLTAGDAAVSFTATLTNSSAAITWTLTGAGSLSSTSGATVQYTPPEGVTKTESVTLSAASSGLIASATISVTAKRATTITVSGTVFDITGARKVAGASVVVLGKSPVIADASGQFSIPNVTVPYSLAVVDGTGQVPSVNLFVGLTRADPAVFFPGTNGAAPHAASLAGTVSTPNGPFVTGSSPGVLHKLGVAFDSPEAPAGGNLSNPYSLDVGWSGPSTVTGTLHALAWDADPITDLPRTYFGYGKLDNVLIADGSTRANTNLTVTAIPEALLQGSATVPANYKVSRKLVVLEFDNTGLVLLVDASATGSFGYRTPVVPGTTLALQVDAQDGLGGQSMATKHRLAANATGSATLPVAPTLGVPANNTANIDLGTQNFTWSAPNGTGFNAVGLTGPALNLAVFTNGSSFTVPPLAQLGLGALPSGTKLSWNVVSLLSAAFPNVDAFVVPGALKTLFASDIAEGISANRNFTMR